MFFACLAHFAWWLEVAYPALAVRLHVVAMVATPSFVALSGAMIGLRAGRAGRIEQRLRIELADRGIFLLVVAHLLIALSEVHRGGTFAERLLQFNTVDVIAIGCLLFALAGNALLRMQPWQVAFLALSLTAVGWAVALGWHPIGTSGRVAEELLVGQLRGAAVIGYACPLAQFMTLFLLGSVLGRLLAGLERGRGLEAAATPLLAGGLLLAAIALGARVAVRALVPAADADPWLESTMLTQRVPPSPGYMALFGGLSLAMCGAIIALWRSGRCAALLEALAVVGRVSLFVFVLQYFVFWTLPDLLGIVPGPGYPLVFAAEMALIWACAWGFGRINGNRWLSIGLRRIATR